ncbi:hypothetical protein L484_015019 [Morus notabilis]|uniref:Uncharacterized protein n=1 Tax=Morus notabilis TaxID=981085 RepID=W9S3V0_9ROSA|nr:uncharacterized protein LOC21398134 [Morus notabilis]EXB87888.1 hypothetical protein L484_015019 [Morus notabilis]
MEATPNIVSLSPSFNNYSSSTGNLTDIAARVVSELRRENSGSDAAFFLDEEEDDHIWFHAELDQRRPHRDHHDHHDHRDGRDDGDEEDDGDDEFEFAFVCRESASSPISADEIFYNGQIRPVYYPLLGKSLQLLEEHGLKSSRNDVVAVAAARANKENDKNTPPAPPRRRQPLRKLMVEEERETTTSCSSSETDELDGLQHGTFCVWTPRNGDSGAATGGGKKSKSTGSSKRWKFGDLISRGNSDGKDRTILVIAPSKKASKEGKATGNGTATKTEVKNEVVFAAGKVGKAEEHKRKTYKQDFVGFLANVHGLSRNLHPF